MELSIIDEANVISEEEFLDNSQCKPFLERLDDTEEFKIKVCEIEDIWGLKYINNYDHILSFLDVKDLLSLSETCFYWNFFIGRISQTSMNRIKLVVNEKHDRRIDEVVDSTIRFYKHIEIIGLFDKSPGVIDLICKNKESLVSIRSSYDFELKPNLLPNVKKIFLHPRNFDNHQSKIFNDGLISAATNIEELIIWGNFKFENFLEVINNCLYLKKLGLEFGACHNLYKFDDVTQFNFKLETFYCDSAKNTDSFLKFVHKHRATLKDVKFKGPLDTAKDLLCNLPELERITFYQNSLESNLYLNTNRVYKNLKEANFIEVHPKVIQHLISQAPNLHTVYISTLNSNLLKFIANKASFIKHLKYAKPHDDEYDGFKELSESIFKNMSNNNQDNNVLKLTQI